MAIEAENSVVGIKYELTEVGKDKILDGDKNGMALEFITGKGQIIPGLESQLIGMKEGDAAKIEVKAVDAYGEYNDEAVQVLPKEQFEGVDLEPGMSLYGQSEDGQQVQVIVKSFTDSEVTIDYNHPLAGMDLLFDVVVDSVRPATAEEIESGIVGGAAGDSCEGGSCGCGH